MTDLTSYYGAYIYPDSSDLDEDLPLDVASVWRLHNNARHFHDSQGQVRVNWSSITSMADTYTVASDITTDYPWRHMHTYFTPWSVRSDGTPLNALIRMGGFAFSEGYLGIVAFFTTIQQYNGYLNDYVNALGYAAALSGYGDGDTMMVDEVIDLSAITDFVGQSLRAFPTKEYDDAGTLIDSTVYTPVMRIAIYGAGSGGLTHVSVREVW